MARKFPQIRIDAKRIRRIITWLVEGIIGKIVCGVIVGVVVAIIVNVLIVNNSEPDIFIESAQFDAPGDELDPIDGEWVKITNRGESDENLSGWMLCDRDGHSMEFPPDFILSAGQSVKVHTGLGENCEADLYWRRGSPVWTNEGDTASLYDSDHNLVDQWSSW